MSNCSNCGWEKSPNELTSLRVITQLGTPQEIAVCTDCIDYCTPDEPTEMFTLVHHWSGRSLAVLDV